MKKLKKSLTVVIVISSLIFTFSCQKEFELYENQFENTTVNDGSIKLGKKLKNPYTVYNMQTAYNNITGNVTKYKNADEVKVIKTHLYVRFLPESEVELALWKKDKHLELFDYPLDYELEEGGTYYHDPSVPEDQITWQYCTVKKNYNFPTENYEIIEELYLPEEEGNKFKELISEYFWNALISETLRITGNLKKTGKVSGWHPSGKIRVWDSEIGTTVTSWIQVFDHYEYYNCNSGNNGEKADSIKTTKAALCKRAVYISVPNTSITGSYIPVVGCKVRAVNWFHVEIDYTDANGNFYIADDFTNSVDYSIKWEDPKWDIRDGNIFQAYYNGPNESNSPWNLNIGSNTDTGKSLRFATIHRAVYRYSYQNIGGLKRPPDFTPIKIAYIDNVGTGIDWGNN